MVGDRGGCSVVGVMSVVRKGEMEGVEVMERDGIRGEYWEGEVM